MDEELENARVEYWATNDSYMHYDAFRWQAGSFLVAGVFIFWGLLIQNSVPDSVIVAATFLVAALMSIWLLFAHHYRQIYMWKLHRLWQLEWRLGARQHLRFRPDVALNQQVRYKTIGPKGHDLDIAIYLVTSTGSVVLGVARSLDPILLLPIMPILYVALYVLTNERAFKKVQEGVDPQTPG